MISAGSICSFFCGGSGEKQVRKERQSFTGKEHGIFARGAFDRDLIGFHLLNPLPKSSALESASFSSAARIWEASAFAIPQPDTASA